MRLLTAPLEEGVFDANGNPSNFGWLEAVHFAHNLNHESSASVTGDTLTQIAEAHGIGDTATAGAILIAELNGLAYALDKGGNFYLPYSGPTKPMLNPDRHHRDGLCRADAAAA